MSRFNEGDVVMRPTTDGPREGVVVKPKSLKSIEFRDFDVVWAYWRRIGNENWPVDPTWTRAKDVVKHPDPDPVIVSFALWTLTR